MGFLSLLEDRVAVVLEEEGEKGTFYLKRVLSKLDINAAFLETLEAIQSFNANRPKVEEPDDDDDEPKKAQPITLDLILGMINGPSAILKRAVVGWDLRYPSGHPKENEPIEFSVELVDGLSGPTVDQLCEELKRLNRSLTPEEVRNLGSRSSPVSNTEPIFPEN